MNAARPITVQEYKTLLAELYTEGKSSYTVDLDSDPAANPRLINSKLERVQSYKNRVVTILNKAVANQAYWKAIVKKMETRKAAAENAAMVTEAVKNEKNAESRKAAAAIAGAQKVVETMFKGEGTYEDHYCQALNCLADAESFLSEVENVYKNLDSTDMNLAVQQKNVLLCVKLAGAGITLEDREEARAVSAAV